MSQLWLKMLGTREKAKGPQMQKPKTRENSTTWYVNMQKLVLDSLSV